MEFKSKLVNWCFEGRVAFWMQACYFSSKTLKVIWSIVYCFMWDGKKIAKWKTITKSEKKRGLGSEILY